MTREEFDEAYRVYVDTLFRFATRLTARRDVGEEITGDTFLALVERLDRIETAQLPAWLFATARNRAIDYWRRQAVEVRYLESLAPRPARPEEDQSVEDWLDEIVEAGAQAVSRPPLRVWDDS